MSRKKRIGVVISRAGVPSEVWVQSQFAAFEQVEPVLFYWEMDDPGLLPSGTEQRRFSQPFHRPFHALKAAAKRLGLAYGGTPTAAQKADIRRTVLSADVDALLCHFSWTGLAVSEALAGEIPVVWQVHGRDVSAKLKEPFYRRAIAQVLPKVDHVIAVGSHQIELLKAMGRADALSLIPCGAPLEAFSARPLPERAENEPCRFIAVSRISPEKGIAETIEAFDRIVAEGANAELVIVGKGPLLDWAQARAAALPSRERIRFTGHMARDDLPLELSKAHVFVQHSRDVNGWIEGFGVSITEGAAAGLPLVVSSLGGVPDQVTDGVNGLLFAPGDVAGQAERMMRLASDEPLRRRLGAAARQVAMTFDAVPLARQVEQVLLSVAR